MTTIILTIIGILLAAAAALMVIFYGGDAFNTGSAGAAANTYKNAGTNVMSAIELYKIDNIGEQPSIMTDLTNNGKYLKEVPNVPDPGGISHTLNPFTDAVLNKHVVYAVNVVDIAVCNRINNDYKISVAPLNIPRADNYTTTPKTGCIKGIGSNLSTFYITN